MANAINQLTSMPKLPLTSGLMETKTPTPKGYVGASEIGPALEELRGAEAKAEQDVGLADIKIEEAKRQEKATEAEKRMLRAEQFATEMREMPERKTVEETRKQLGESAFVPTPETFQDLATMFTLMGVIGMVIGKDNAQAGMAAMNGMLEGHQKGRADLYKKEKDIFEKNFKVLQQKLASAEKGLEEAIRLKTVEKEAGDQKLLMELYKTESPLLMAMYEKQGPIAVLNSVRGARKDADTVVNVTNNLQKAADDRQFAKDEKERARSLALQIANIKASGGGVGAIPKDKETNNEHRFRYSALQNVKEVLEALQDPKVRKLIGPQNQYMPDVFLNLQKGFPEIAQKLARFQSEEFKIGGKALTASEQKILGPIYNWRGLTAGALEENLREAERAMDKEQLYLENRYPGLAQIDYGGAPKSKYSVGQIIEKGGKKYRITDTSNPDDPDVEEVK